MSQNNSNFPKTAAELSERYGTAVRRFIGRRVQDHAKLEDLTQQVFERLLRRAALTSLADVQGHLFQVAASVLAEPARTVTVHPAILQRGVSGDIAEHEDTLEHSHPDTPPLDRDAQARVIAALWELPANVRAVFFLSRFEEMQAREIAARVGISIMMVEQNMRRAVKHVRDSVK